MKKKSPSLQERRTPEWLVSELESYFGHRFKLDAAASPGDYVVPKYYTKKANGLERPWVNWTFCNPPFENFGDWIRKAYYEGMAGVHSILLGPTACSQSWLHRYVQPYTTFVPDCRISYDLPNGEPTHGADRDTMIFAFGPQFKNINAVSFCMIPIALKEAAQLDKLWRG